MPKQFSRRRNVLLCAFLLLLAACGPKEPTLEETLAAVDQAMNEGRIDDAIARMEVWEEKHPGTVEILDPLAFAYAMKGDEVMAAYWFTRIAEVDPSQPDYLKFAAESLRKAGDNKGATDLYREFLSREADDKAVWITLAQLEQSLGNRSAAIEAWMQANRIEPEGEAQTAIGRLFLQANNLAQAQVWFASAAALGDGARAEALLGLLETALRAQRFEDAEILVAELDREFPGTLDQSPLAKSRTDLATWRKSMDDAAAAAERITRRREAAEAAAAAERAPTVAPTVVPPPVTVTEASPPEPTATPTVTPAEEAEPASGGFPEDKEGMVDAEEARMATVAPAPPPPPPAAPTGSSAADPLSEARAARDAGNYPAAIRAYKNILVRADADPEIWLELSDTYLRNGQSSWAVATASEAMRRAPDDPRYTLHYLRASQQTLTSDRLIREMERAYRQFPNNPEIMLVLARAYDELENNRRNAALLYMRFLETAPSSHPEYAAVRQALDRL